MLVKTLTAATGLFLIPGMLAAQTAPAHDNRRLTVSVAASLRNLLHVRAMVNESERQFAPNLA